MSASPEQMTRTAPAARLVPALALAAVVNTVGSLAIGPFPPFVAGEPEASVALGGRVTALTMLPAALLGPVIGPLADHDGFRRTLIGGLLATASRPRRWAAATWRSGSARCRAPGWWAPGRATTPAFNNAALRLGIAAGGALGGATLAVADYRAVGWVSCARLLGAARMIRRSWPRRGARRQRRDASGDGRRARP